MDPDANWAEQRRLMRDIAAETDETARRVLVAELGVMHAHLQGWLRRGGFAPASWSDKD